MSRVGETINLALDRNPLEGDSNFDQEGFWIPDRSIHTRGVRSLSDFRDVSEKSVVVVKRAGSEHDLGENRAELLNYLEADTRDSSIFPEVYGGTTDLSVILVEHYVNSWDDYSDVETHPDWDNWEEQSTNYRGVPDIQWGLGENNNMCPVDYGTMEPVDGYQHFDPDVFDSDRTLGEIASSQGFSDQVDIYSVAGRNFFEFH